MNKRRQATNEKIQNQLLEITRENDSLRLNNQRLRDNLIRMEKDRNTLELKLKSANGKINHNIIILYTIYIQSIHCICGVLTF